MRLDLGANHKNRVMKKAKKTMGSTDSGRVYRMAKRETLDCCPICAPHKGCNQWKAKRQRNWKKYRKTQWKPQTQDSCNELWSERTDDGCNHMSHEITKEGVSTPQETGEIRKAS